MYEFITVGSLVLFVIAFVGLVGAGMDWWLVDMRDEVRGLFAC